MSSSLNSVRFFGGDQQAWSIGYRIDHSRYDVGLGARKIYRATLFEVSPVLFGKSLTCTITDPHVIRHAYAQVTTSFVMSRPGPASPQKRAALVDRLLAMDVA